MLFSLDGEPLANVEVALHDFLDRGHVVDRTTTDASGRFALWGRPSFSSFMFHAPGYVSAWAIHDRVE